MANIYSPKPIHHTVVDWPLDNPRGQTVRVIMTQQGVFRQHLEYILKKQSAGARRSWVRNTTRAIGLFYDFVVQLGPAYRGKERELLSAFAQSLLSGTVRREGDDPTGLYWGVASWDQVKSYLNAIKEFSDWCQTRYGAKSVYQIDPWSWGARIANYRRLDKMYTESFLRHTIDHKNVWKKAAESSFYSSGAVTSISTSPPIFSEDLFLTLITEGFRLPGYKPNGLFHEQYNVRDIMITILLGFGGLRESEPMHLWVQDIIVDPKDQDKALVFIHHPKSSQIKTLDPVTKKYIWLTRREYLFLQKGGYLPRDEYQSGPIFAGWKNPLMIKTGRQFYMPVYFNPPHIAKSFLRLYRIYMDYVRPKDCDHPWLFVGLDAKSYKKPLSIAAYLESYTKAMASIGIKETKKEDGTTPHGLRYLYAQRLNEALSYLPESEKKQIIRLCLHHKALKSQEVYTEPELKKLTGAFAKIESIGPTDYLGHQLDGMFHV